MRKDRIEDGGRLTRRQTLTGTAALGVALALGGSGRAEAKERIAAAQPGASVCILTPEATQGPFYFDPKLVRADITEGKQGAKLKLTLQVVEAETCTKLAGARVDIWHSDGLGVYSGYVAQETGSTPGETFLRGTQFTDADGEVRFDTIYPGWYPGRTPHIHFKVILDETDLITGQLYFPDTLSERLYATLSLYRERREERDTINANDFIFQRQGGAETVLSIAEKAGDEEAYFGTLVIGIARSRRS
jgi:protocatechuate 3,4-dioxygenase beta subunit